MAQPRHVWPLVATALGERYLGRVIALSLTNPLLLHPYAVLARLQARTLDMGTTQLMAGLLPVMSITALLVLLALLLCIIDAMRREQRYLTIIDSLQPPTIERLYCHRGRNLLDRCRKAHLA